MKQYNEVVKFDAIGIEPKYKDELPRTHGYRLYENEDEELTAQIVSRVFDGFKLQCVKINSATMKSPQDVQDVIDFLKITKHCFTNDKSGV